MVRIHIKKYSHFFTVVTDNPAIVSLLLKFSTRYIQRVFQNVKGRNVLVPSKVFAERTKSNVFRFVNGQYEPLIRFLEVSGITKRDYEESQAELYEIYPVTYKVNPKYETRDYQVKVKDFIIDPLLPETNSRLVAMPTGTGKGYTAMWALSIVGGRALVVVLSRYIQKWVDELQDVLDVTEDDIYVVKGNNSLRFLLRYAEEGELESKVIVMSLNTVQGFFDDYKKYEEDIVDYGYPCVPEDMCKILGVNWVISDESHQNMYMVFRTLLYTHAPKVVALTATLLSKDPFINNMQHVMFPKEIRYNKVPMKKYIDLKSYAYRFEDTKAFKHMRYTNRGSYSHVEFEKSLIRNKRLMNSYIDFIFFLTKVNYIDKREEGDKCLVFASTIDFCTILTERFTKRYPDLKVSRYVEKDTFDAVLDSDITISTLLSAGTAFDIPNLITSIMTVSVDSPVTNVQALGRLRFIKDKELTFAYIYCSQIPKHVKYHNSKLELFKDRVLDIKDYNGAGETLV